MIVCHERECYKLVKLRGRYVKKGEDTDKKETHRVSSVDGMDGMDGMDGRVG